jgi:hypothetical protein
MSRTRSTKPPWPILHFGQSLQLSSRCYDVTARARKKHQPNWSIWWNKYPIGYPRCKYDVAAAEKRRYEQATLLSQSKRDFDRNGGLLKDQKEEAERFHSLWNKSRLQKDFIFASFGSDRQQRVGGQGIADELQLVNIIRNRTRPTPQGRRSGARKTHKDTDNFLVTVA